MDSLKNHPYYSKYNPDKNYKLVLTKPGLVAQSREIIELQLMQQDRSKRIAQAALGKDGSVVSGCSLVINEARTSITISPGSVYADGEVISFSSPVTIPITGTGVEIIGLKKTESFITSSDDPDLLDPAVGHRNYRQPGADRLKVVWEWKKLSIAEQNSYPVFTLIDGNVPATQSTIPAGDGVVYQPTFMSEDEVLRYISTQNYEQFGNFVVSGLDVSVTDHPVDRWNRKLITIRAGKARILGKDYTFSKDWVGDLALARETQTVLDEPWTYQRYDSYWNSGGAYVLANTPVCKVDRVTATVLVVDGGGNHGGVIRPYIVRGSVPGSSDLLSVPTALEIIAVNRGGTWNPQTESFEGGYTYPPSSYQLLSSRISWAPAGPEPGAGESYSVAYKARMGLVKQIVAKELVTNELVVHGDATGNDVLDHRLVCETNEFTELKFYAYDPVGGNPPSGTPGVDFDTKYVRGVDFTVGFDGVIDWYNHEIQILGITKGSVNGTDNLTGFTGGFSMGRILAVAWYSNPADMSFDKSTHQFVNPTNTYAVNTDYTYSVGVPSISWAPGGAEPSTGLTYFVAVLARRYKTSNHPAPGASYYVTYHYWKTKVPGDYLARDSFYRKYVGPNSPQNEKQIYGLDLADSVNFYLSDNFRASPNNMDKPYPNTLVEFDYSFYLPRWVTVDCVDGKIHLTYGSSNLNPVEPVFQYETNSVPLAKIFCPPDSLLVQVIREGCKTFKVHDIHDIKRRLDRTEENVAKSWVDLDAHSIPVERKRGVFATDFRDFSGIDQGWQWLACSIDPVWAEAAMPHTDSFYSTTVDSNASTALLHFGIGTLTYDGEEIISQTLFTEDESIAPYATVLQNYLSVLSSSSLTIKPSSDTLIIPRVATFETRTDAERWLKSDVSKLTDPTGWFSRGWVRTGATASIPWSVLRNQIFSGYRPRIWNVGEQREIFENTYLRDIQGNCRQLTITWSVKGLIPTSQADLDYFISFGNRLVTPTLTNGTPQGSVPGSFRPRPSDRGASGTFVIPPDVPEGNIEVKVFSTPILVNGKTWRHEITTVYQASVIEQLTLRYLQCVCWCWCWCWCRCGTGPLAQSIEGVTGRPKVFKSITVDFTKVHPLYGVFCSILPTVNGVPTSFENAGGATLGTSYLSPSQLSGGGEKTFTFDDPVFTTGETISIILHGEEAFNMRSIEEISEGRDIRVKVAKMGSRIYGTDTVVGSQPFKHGVLFRSLTGVTWEEDMITDLTFTAKICKFKTNNEQIVYMNPISVENVTAFYCAWESEVYRNTSIIFEYRTQSDVWREFQPYRLTELSEIASVLQFRARLLSTDAYISPRVALHAGVYTQSRGTSCVISTRCFELTEPADTLDVYLDSFLDTDCEQQVRVTFDEGNSWVNLANPVQGRPVGNLIEYSPVDLNVGNVKYRHHWRVTLNSPQVFTRFRIEIRATSSGASARLRNPRFSRCIGIASMKI